MNTRATAAIRAGAPPGTEAGAPEPVARIHGVMAC